MLPLNTNATCTINNNDQPATLTLVKVVNNGTTGATAVPANWTLTATGPTTITGPGNSVAVTNQTVNAGSYALTESGGPAGYTASAWSCTGATLTGATVAVPNGGNVSCTITNTVVQPTLTLVKVVNNATTGGTAVPANWTLSAVNGGTLISGPGNSPSVTNQPVSVGTWTLSESGGPAGYTAGNWSCTGASLSGTALTIVAGSNATCTITNTAQQPRLTLVKTVTNDNGGTAAPTAWTLTATGPTTGITGSTGAAAVTNVPVQVGNYTLAESGGPAGYTGGAWSCTGATVTGSTVAIALGANATCTINNDDIGPHLTLVKTVTNDNGGTAVPTAWTLTAAGPTPISGATGSAAVTNAAVNAGTYTLSETGPAGYTASAWSCTAGTLTGASLVLPLNTSATCTINNNDIGPHLTLVKTVTNDNGGTAVPTAWTLTATGPTTITGATGSAAVTNAAVNAGTYLLSETGPAGYQAGSWSCTAGTLTGASLVLPLNTNATCTINNNDQPATLTLVKVVNNGTTGATAVPANWTLTATGPTTITGPGNSVAVTNQTVNAGSYALTESGGPAGYTASAWSCTGATLTGATVAVPNGGNVSCTITNTVVQPTLTLVKVVNNATTGGTAVPANWTLSAVNGGTLISGPGNSPSVTNQPVPVGDYLLSEAGGPDGYAPGSWACTGGAAFAGDTVTLAAGSNATCTITNTAQQAHLTLVKTVTNDNGGTATANQWTLAATGPTTGITGPTGSGSVTNVPVSPGTYALGESNGPAGYTASGWTCTTGTLTGANLTLDLGQNATCTITNDDQPATLTLVKTVTNDNGGTAAPTDWTLTADGPTTGVSGATGSPAVTAVPVSAGTYDLTESGGPAGYTAGAWSCTAGTLTGASLALANGVTATCTIANNDQPAELTLVKTVTNDNGGTAVPTDWTLTADGPTSIAGATGSPTVTAAIVDAGSYDLSEAGPAGYTAGAWSCVGATQTGSTVVLPPGGAATCTIDNDDQPATLSLTKTVDNGTTGATFGPADWTLTADGPTPITGAGGSVDVENQTVSAGTYSLSEDGGPDGYTASAWSCNGARSIGSTVVVPNGGDVRCTITNTVIQPMLTLVKVVNVGHTGDTATPADWTLTASGPTLVTGPGNSAEVTSQPVQVGDYALSEAGGPAGYTPSGWSCVGADTSGEAGVTIGPGDDVTCTITNSAEGPTLTLIKVVDNDTTGGTAVATDWTLTATGPTTISGQTGISEEVPIGTYSLSEDGPAGYDASAWNCTGGTDETGTKVDVGLKEIVTCTVINTAQQPHLTLVKTVTNDNGGTADATDWTLSATGPSTINGATGTPGVTGAPVQIGSYDLAESGGPAGYAAGDWSCLGATVTGSTVAIALGDDATCTISNNDQPAELTLVKDVDNPDGSGGTAAPTDWTLSADGPTAISGSSGSDPVTGATVDAGTYTLAEADGPAGYAAGAWTCTGATVNGTAVTVPNGGDVTCTITNTARQAHLTLVKTVTNDDGGTAVPTDWTLTADGPTTGISGSVGDDAVTGTPVAAGDYVLAESGGPAGYAAGDWSCTGATLNGATVTIGLGDDVTCTIHNNDQPAQLTLVKHVDPGTSGDTTPATAWTLTATGPTPITGTTGSSDVTGATVNAGTYDLTESGPAGFAASSWDCGAATISGSTVSVPNGSDVTCQITNTAVAPTLTLVKIVDNGTTGGTHTADDWALTADGPTLFTVTTGVTSSAQVGTYDLSESGPAGYTDSAWSCTGAAGGTATSVRLALNENATCTITNTAQQSHLTLVKTVVNDDGGTAAPTDWTLTATGPTTGITGPVGDTAVTDVPVQIGSYQLAESGGPAGYTGGDWSCTGGSLTGSTVSVALGDDVTCTIINNDVLGTWDLTKSSDPASGTTVLPDDLITYTVTATKTGGVNPVDQVVNDDLSRVLDHATLVGQPTVTTGTASITGTTLTWDIPSLSGIQTVVYTVRVDPGAYGVTIGNAVTGSGSSTCPPADPGEECSTSHPTPHYTLTKTSDPASGATIQPGDTVTYTLTTHNDSDGVVSGAVVTDNLSAVLDNATLGTVGAGGAITGTTLTWTVPTLQPGGTATLSYTVTVNDGAWGVALRNVATPGPGGDCTTSCSTTHPTPRWLLAKSSDPASGSTVQPGAKITYTLTARNVSDAVVTRGVATDDLSDVLNHATLDAVPAGATLSGTTLSWTLPELQPGQTATLSYTVTVDSDALGQRLHNVATPGPAGSCVPAGDPGDARDLSSANARAAAFSVVHAAAEDPEACQTTHLIPDWTLTKTSNPASGSTVQPGGAVTYTLTAHNPSAAVVTGAVATDDLGGVLDHATLRQPLPSGAALSGTTLTWTVPTLQPGGTARLSYTVTVAADAYDTTLTNVATPGGYGHCAGSCTTTHHTPNKPVPPPPTPPPPHPGLPNTGGPSLLPAGIGAGLLIAGGLLVIWSRRRKAS